MKENDIITIIQTIERFDALKSLGFDFQDPMKMDLSADACNQFIKKLNTLSNLNLKLKSLVQSNLNSIMEIDKISPKILFDYFKPEDTKYFEFYKTKLFYLSTDDNGLDHEQIVKQLTNLGLLTLDGQIKKQIPSELAKDEAKRKAIARLIKYDSNTINDSTIKNDFSSLQLSFKSIVDDIVRSHIEEIKSTYTFKDIVEAAYSINFLIGGGTRNGVERYQAECNAVENFFIEKKNKSTPWDRYVNQVTNLRSKLVQFLSLLNTLEHKYEKYFNKYPQTGSKKNFLSYLQHFNNKKNVKNDYTEEERSGFSSSFGNIICFLRELHNAVLEEQKARDDQSKSFKQVDNDTSSGLSAKQSASGDDQPGITIVHKQSVPEDLEEGWVILNPDKSQSDKVSISSSPIKSERDSTESVSLQPSSSSASPIENSMQPNSEIQNTTEIMEDTTIRGDVSGQPNEQNTQGTQTSVGSPTAQPQSVLKKSSMFEKVVNFFKNAGDFIKQHKALVIGGLILPSLAAIIFAPYLIPVLAPVLAPVFSALGVGAAFTAAASFVGSLGVAGWVLLSGACVGVGVALGEGVEWLKNKFSSSQSQGDAGNGKSQSSSYAQVTKACSSEQAQGVNIEKVIKLVKTHIKQIENGKGKNKSSSFPEELIKIMPNVDHKTYYDNKMCQGLVNCYRELKTDVQKENFGEILKTFSPEILQGVNASLLQQDGSLQPDEGEENLRSLPGTQQLAPVLTGLAPNPAVSAPS